MKIYTTSVKDPVTSLEVIASDVSFNMACSYLEEKLGTENCERVEFIDANRIKIRYSTRTFIYDENRGLLLGE